jgi:hypothetical protein
LFFVVVTIKPARANRENERMMRATITSINENPFDLASCFNWDLPFKQVLQWKFAKPIPRDFLEKMEEGKIRDYSTILKGCNSGVLLGGTDGRDFGGACYEKIKPLRQNDIG